MADAQPPPFPVGTPPVPRTHVPSRASAKAIPDLISELWQLIKGYLQQETLVPLKAVGKYVLFGTAGALLFGIGVVMLAVGVLRVLQTETETTFTGNLSWIPYLIVFVVLAGGGAACIAAIQGKKTKQASRPGPKGKK